ncbi:MAG: fructosamine kinase family protein [Methylovulum sp.]|uniref:fructosamine kinase family protein n=1 Tax=Methylovulum sp. TaxID=1916980 RepID=UPI0026148B11|nr:fructosamine kinase family protein [Methylovulum sp.]MDD2723955.1 fructosamine kinase family protein [Methylovulum sp.]MDD5125744.1 fructosamine kinase family protein [Methylovulum sp.]
MKHQDTFKDVAKQISTATGKHFEPLVAQPITGGDINSAFRLQGGEQSYFVKLNRPQLLDMFEAEQAGLHELAASQTLRVPLPIVSGKTEGHAFLVMEHIVWGANTSTTSRLLGQQLALMHQPQQAYFGWHRDNTIGSTPQSNRQHADWPTFWRDQRLGVQLNLAKANGYGGRLQSLGEQLCGHINAFFSSYHPTPSLLHGDLWGGNTAVDQQGRPVIFDPACYYGDRETDLAMTELFGGFDRDFYAAYQSAWPVDPGFSTRKILYNLYHILNHLNLFGGGYARQAESQLAKLLSEIK